jgi:uncharacterized protein YdiU (UPF0061 family)
MFDNSYARLPENFYVRVSPAHVPAPCLLAWNEELAQDLGISELGDTEKELAWIFGGNEVPAGAEPIALAYAGHQFGHFVPQLGDGRAVLLGEVLSAEGRRYDVQLKGSGQTPFSRNGDGKSSLGPVIREYIVSEAMHYLGVPTTRALAAVTTGEKVYRETTMPGAVLTRVASSHVRVGTFEFFAARGEQVAVRTLADYAIARLYPEVRDEVRPYRDFFRQVLERQAALIAHWMDVGFIHGVMNTDNTSIAGETIDYGPCAYMDEFQPDKVFSSIDRAGRYAYGRQAAIAHWNLTRLAECLLLVDDDQPAFEEELGRFSGLFQEHYHKRMRTKLGLTTDESDDEDLIGEWLQHLQSKGRDYTMSFRQLGARIFSDGPPEFGEFELKWKRRIDNQPQALTEIQALMNSVNPLYIARNHQVEKAIQNAIAGNLSTFEELLEVLKNPFQEQREYARYATPPAPEQRVTQTFCGT